MKFSLRNLLLPALFFVPTVASAQSADPTYWQDIRPIFRKHCTVCHNARQAKKVDISGGLALDTYEAVRKGTQHAVLTPGKADDSILVRLLVTTDKEKRMPLESQPLEAPQIALIKRWIDTGAKEGTKPADVAEEPKTTTIKSVSTRKLDVNIATAAVPPADVLGKMKPGPLELHMKVGPLAPVTAVAFSPDGKLLVSACYGQVTVWDLARGEPTKIITTVLGAVNDLQFSPDGKIIAVAGGQPSAKGDLRLFHVADWKLLHTIRGHDDVIFSVAFRKDGKQLATASFDKTVRIWDVASANMVSEHSGHSDFVYAVAFSPDGKQLVSCSKDRTVKITELATGKGLLTLGGVDSDITALAYSPDGKFIVSSGFDSRIYWWNPETGERVRLQGGHGVGVNELAFSKDGTRLVSAGADRTARTWDAAAGTVLKSLAVGSQVYAVAISPDAKTVATGSFDGMVRLWNEADARQLVTLVSLPSRDDKADWLTLTPQGALLSSPGLTSIARWRVLGQEIAAADRIWTTLRQPQDVAKALRGDKITTPAFKK